MNPSNLPVPNLHAAALQRERRLFVGRPPWLHEEVAAQMAQRLDWFVDRPKDWLDWAPSWGGMKAHVAIGKHAPKAQRWVFEPEASRGKGTKPASRWPWTKRPHEWTPSQKVDLLWANMGLRGELMPQALMQQWMDALRPGGVLMFSALGPHTLEDLRRIHAKYAWGEAMAPLTDMHDWGDMLVQAGFADPVMDASRLSLTYSSALSLLKDLRAMGVNTHEGRFAGCRGRSWRRAFEDALQRELPRDSEGRLVLEVEVVWGQAIAPKSVKAQPGETAISVSRMKEMLKSVGTGR